MLEAALSGHTSKDVSVRTADGSVVLLRLGLNRLQLGVESLLCAVATDITLERKRNTELRHLSETLEARIAERTAELTASRFAIMNMMEEEVESRRVAETANRDLTQQITDRKQAEAERDLLQAQLIQSQKLESVGRLAGGVAHDFNNVLQVIIGNAEYALERTKPSDPIHAELEQINKSGQHAADLTRQLLAFARKQTIQPRKLDLNETLENMLKMLSRLIGENIKLVWKPQAGLWLVRMDPCQIEQILANLCVNARDAIGNFGEVQIATRNVCVDESMALRHEDFPPGDYVLFTISDTGCGMDQETQSHIFEPFFTTKGVGQGTGLGLATVYGIVKQNKGHIGVDSEPGKCTTFRISLPRYLGADSVHSTDSPAKTPVRGHETVMLVEDDLSVLTMVERTLRGLGYTVLSAATPEAALAVRLAGRLVQAGKILADNDGLIALKGAHAGKPGIICIAGTGTITLG
ncbi:MAG: ATP-binding protein, partial [Kiritimatiellia bacterium]